MSILRPNRPFCRLLAALAFLVLAPGAALAATSHFQGQGIAIDYPDKYQLSDEQTKHGWKLQLKSGPNSLVLNVYPNPLIDGFDEMVTDSVKSGFEEQGRPLTDVRTERVSLPIRVGKDKDAAPVEVDAIRYSHTVNVNEGKVKLAIHQTMYFFSQGGRGYMLNFTGINAPKEDLEQILSSLVLEP